MIKLVINTANAAFADGDKNSEVARIINDAADRIEDGRFDVSGLRKRIIQLSDVNGNKVGTLLEGDEPIHLNYGDDARIVLDMDTDNSAFEGDSKGAECARILREAAGKIRGGDLSFKLRDVNGNTVGKVDEVGGVEVAAGEQKFELLKLYARKEPTTDSVAIEHGLAEKKDTVFYRDAECTDMAGRYSWHLSNCPRRGQDMAMLNCYKWKLEWLDDLEKNVAMDAANNVEASFENRLAEIQSEWEHAVGESDESRNFTDWLSTEHPRIVSVQYSASCESGFITSPAMLDLETGEVAGMDIPDFDELDTPVINNEFIETLENDCTYQASVELLPDDSTRVTSKDELANLQGHFGYVPERGRLTLDTMRPDVKGKLIVENAVSLDDAELSRVFSGVVLEGFCIREGQRARAGGVTMDDIRAEDEKQRQAQKQIAEVPAFSLYRELKAVGVPMDNHESDLYVPVTSETTAILAKYPTNKANATRFKSNIDGVLNYDIPFAYEPFWEKGSLHRAEKMAREKESYAMVDAAVDQKHEGKVFGVTDYHVVLSLGRTALIIAQADIDRVPVKDEDVVVKFKDGKGNVEPVKGKEVDQGR